MRPSWSRSPGRASERVDAARYGRRPAGRRARGRTGRPHRAGARCLIAVGALAQAAGPCADRPGDRPRHRSRRPRRARLDDARAPAGSTSCGALAHARRRSGVVGAVGQRVLARACARASSRTSSALPLGFFDRRPIGDLMSRVINDVDTLNQLFSQGLIQLLGVAVRPGRHHGRDAGAQLPAGAGLLRRHPGRCC